MTKKKVGPWGAVPLAILRDSEVKPNMLKVYTALSAYQGMNGKCWPSRKEISAMTGLAQSSVSESVGKLVETGWIQRTRRSKTNGTNVYNVMSDVEETEEPMSGKSGCPENPDIPCPENPDIHLYTRTPNENISEATISDESSLNWKDVETFFTDEEGWVSIEYGRQRKACKVFVTLIEEEFSESSQEALTGVLSTFRRLHRGKDTFWAKMPYKPSTAVSEKVAPLLFKAYRDERKTNHVSADFNRPDWMEELNTVRPRANRAYDLFEEGED